MSRHLNPDALDAHLDTMCDLVRDGATNAEAKAWLYCDAPHGPGIEPGVCGWRIYFPKKLRSKLPERHREIVALRKRGWRYEAISMAVNIPEGTVGQVCRDAGLGCDWYARASPKGKRQS